MDSPGRYDPVYKILERLFKAKSDCHLNRGKKMRTEIRELAQKRFNLGYPPRKPGDISIGDSINWEWIIYCAKHCNDDIIIISRDTDFGQHYKEKSYINDWLLQEFKERVNRKRSIILTRLLSEGFKLAGIDVAREEEQAEESFIINYPYILSESLRFAYSNLNSIYSNDVLQSAFSKLNSIYSNDVLQSAFSKLNSIYSGDALNSSIGIISNEPSNLVDKSLANYSNETENENDKDNSEQDNKPN